MNKDFEKMTIREFMEWYVVEYEGHYLASDFSHTIDRLEGYSLAKRGSDESYILESALTLLKESKGFFEAVKRYANWKYRP